MAAPPFHFGVRIVSSSIYSNTPSCNISIRPIPTKPIAVAKAVRVGSTTVFIDDKNCIYCSSIKDGFAYPMSYANRQQFQDLYRGLVKLGVIPKKDVEAHLTEADAIAKKQTAKWAAEALRKDAKTLGLKLTVAQQRLIDDLAPEKTNG